MLNLLQSWLSVTCVRQKPFSSFFLSSFLPFLFYFPFLIAGRDRTNYLLVKEAKIIAMTCTHAALKRRDLVELGFKASCDSGLLMPL